MEGPKSRTPLSPMQTCKFGHLRGKGTLQEAGAGKKCLRSLSVKHSVMPEAKNGDMLRRISVGVRAGRMRPEVNRSSVLIVMIIRTPHTYK